MRFSLSIISVLSALLLAATPASAQLTITPHEVVIGTAELLTVTAATPEDGLPVVEVRVTIPVGIVVQSVEPKSGWRVTFEREDEAAAGRITEIVWRGGRIDPGNMSRLFFLATIIGEPGDVSFPSLHVHTNGSVTKWTGETPGQEVPVVTLTGQSMVNKLTEDVARIKQAQPVIRLSGFRSTLNTWASLFGVALGGTALYFLYKQSVPRRGKRYR